MIEIAAVDVETTGTDPTRHEVWEAAVVLATHDGGKLLVEDEWAETRHARHLHRADPGALHMNRYYPRLGPPDLADELSDPTHFAYKIAARTAGRQLVGANVAFDAAFLAATLRRNGYRHAWHYSPIDVKALAMGARKLDPTLSTAKVADALLIDRSDLTAHTALDDARLALRIYAWVYDLTIEQAE